MARVIELFEKGDGGRFFSSLDILDDDIEFFREAFNVPVSDPLVYDFYRVKRAHALKLRNRFGVIVDVANYDSYIGFHAPRQETKEVELLRFVVNKGNNRIGEFELSERLNESIKKVFYATNSMILTRDMNKILIDISGIGFDTELFNVYASFGRSEV